MRSAYTISGRTYRLHRIANPPFAKYGCWYEVRDEDTALKGWIHSYDGPGPRDGNRRWFDWYAPQRGHSDGELCLDGHQYWAPSLAECLWEQFHNAK